MQSKLLTGFFAFGLATSLFAEWPQFRGPTGNGISTAKGLPLTWSEEKNVKWKTPTPGRAWSSPVILGKEVWLTTASKEGHELSVLCVDRDSGKVIHDRNLFHVEVPQGAIDFNTFASPTPV